MKRNSFKGFYEDEESLKMMEIINESANKEYAKNQKWQKKAKREDLFVKAFMIISLLFILFTIIYISSVQFKKDVAECVAKGEDQATCEYKFSK